MKKVKLVVFSVFLITSLFVGDGEKAEMNTATILPPIENAPVVATILPPIQNFFQAQDSLPSCLPKYKNKTFERMA